MSEQVPIVHGVLPSGESRPVIVIKVINPDDPSPTVIGNMHTLGAADGFPDPVVPWQGRYDPFESAPGSKRFLAGTFHSPAETEPEPKKKEAAAAAAATAERPIPEVGDAVIVEDGRHGKITTVEKGRATLITLDESGETVTDIDFRYVNHEKAKEDAAYQASKEK